MLLQRNGFKMVRLQGILFLDDILSIGLMYCQSKVLIILMTNFSIGFALGHVLMRTFLVFTILLALISFGINHWHNPSKVSRQLSANSYNIYLLHMIFVVVIQLFLLQWARYFNSFQVRFGYPFIYSL